MNPVHIQETYGPIFGMDQMCDCIAPDGLSVGDTLLLKTSSGDTLRLTIAAIQAFTDEAGALRDVMGIGLRGSGAETVKAGDSLNVEIDPDTA